MRAVMVKVDNFLEKMIVMNINDGGVDRCLQVTLSNIQTLRAFELDVMIDRVNPVIQEDTQLLQELKKTQITAFLKAYLYPNQGIVYVCPTTKQAKHLLVPKHRVKSNMRLIMTLQSNLKYKRNKKHEDVEMIIILDIYLLNPDTMMPNTQYNLRNDKDDDEQKDNNQKPTGSNPSQSSKATGSKDKKQEEKKDDEKKRGNKDTATRAWRSILAEWLIEREERRKRNEAEYEERVRKYGEEIEMFIKRSEELKAKGMSKISKDGKFLNIKAGKF
ncbi:hypothetical protein AgCh_010264 [Apium graveolens]